MQDAVPAPTRSKQCLPLKPRATHAPCQISPSCESALVTEAWLPAAGSLLLQSVPLSADTSCPCRVLGSCWACPLPWNNCSESCFLVALLCPCPSSWSPFGSLVPGSLSSGRFLPQSPRVRPEPLPAVTLPEGPCPYGQYMMFLAPNGHPDFPSPCLWVSP